ncbi:protein TonB [Sphingobium sp. OAS761]|uniref:energy transducer TonB n=1 Tax=Sphingobium sp. OAS761 TaxID=2817901 RepID=UPI0020A17479|nr:energy transducer TonB [Sphingobium sp. OAS761]MCP1470571.1 protein TonB [Sphingobium sp. OAS761]
MLHAASQPIDDYLAEVEPVFSRTPAASPIAAPAFVAAVDRYRAQSRTNLPIIGAILIMHIVAIVALVQVRHHMVRADEASLTVVNLTPPPPPPPAAAVPPPPVAAEVVAPPPVVRTPVPISQPVQTVPDPVPVPVSAPPSVAPSSMSAGAAPPAPPASVQGGDLATQMISGKPPRYPLDSRRKKEQGTVILALTLGLDGTVESIDISRSSGFARLDNAARDAVRNWRWKPTLRGGAPVRVKGVVAIPFLLQGQG